VVLGRDADCSRTDLLAFTATELDSSILLHYYPSICWEYFKYFYTAATIRSQPGFSLEGATNKVFGVSSNCWKCSDGLVPENSSICKAKRIGAQRPLLTSRVKLRVRSGKITSTGKLGPAAPCLGPLLAHVALFRLW
jgi:hypothetical protein